MDRYVRLSSINLAAISDSDNQNSYGAIFDVRDDSAVSNPIFPEITEIRTLQGLSD
jgi:hypothetical protein